MDPNLQKEQFSRAYVHAVAAAAGFATYLPQVDDDSVDLMIAARGPRGTVRSPRLELQLKCTVYGAFTGGALKLALKKKNYDDLRHVDYVVPRLLVVVVVPKPVRDWLAFSEEHLVMRRCGYWSSLRGLPASRNSTSVTVRISQGQCFSPEDLTRLMDGVKGVTA